MNKIKTELKKAISETQAKNESKLKKQQEYYHRLAKQGIAKKETYSLKPVSAI